MNSDLSNWTPPPAPAPDSMRGRYVTLEPAVFPRDGDALFAVLGGAERADLWEHVPIGPFTSVDELSAAMSNSIERGGWITYRIIAPNGTTLGMASYMRIRAQVGSAEIGCIIFSPELQQTALASDAIYAMIRYLFDDLGFRRVEWKCDNANAKSRRAAERFGFTFEGVFRQDLVVKGRNRDTRWYSITDGEWPAIKAGFETWLAPENFDDQGQQIRRLEDCRA